MEQKPYPERHKRTHYGQFGEDIFINKYFNNIDDGFYVDVGCFDPFSISNTALLHKRGWSGINIDIGEDAVERFNEYRPDDINLHMAIGTEQGEQPLYTCSDKNMHTINKETSEQDNGRTYEQSGTILMDTLEHVFATHLPQEQKIHLLDVDAEGSDIEVLQSNNWKKHRPKMVLVESRGFSFHYPMSNEVYAYMYARGYDLVSVYHITLIFVDTQYKER